MTFAKKALIFGTTPPVGAGAATAALAQSTINGAGATFPAPFYQRAFADVAARASR